MKELSTDDTLWTLLHRLSLCLSVCLSHYLIMPLFSAITPVLLILLKWKLVRDSMFLKKQLYYHFSSTIWRICRTITVSLTSPSPLPSPLYWLRFFVHPRNMLISLHILFVWSYSFTTAFPLTQPINADNSGLHYMRVFSPFLDVLFKVYCTPYKLANVFATQACVVL